VNGEPCLCGALDCRWCFPWSWRQVKAEMAHEDHADPEMSLEDCPECLEVSERAAMRAEAEYDRRKEEGWDRWD
jgi:hypothetical protein